MAKEFAKTFYNSKSWKRCRASYITHRQSIDGGMCEECNESVGYIVHHRIPISRDNINNPEITLDFKNLEYVCKACHDRMEAHEFIKQKKLKCRFNDRGIPIPPHSDN